MFYHVINLKGIMFNINEYLFIRIFIKLHYSFIKFFPPFQLDSSCLRNQLLFDNADSNI